MAEGQVPGSAPNTSNKVMARNIITGVVTTVIGASIVYFLGFHAKGGDSGEGNLYARGEKTIKAWQDYVNAENLLFRNWAVLDANYVNTGFDQYKKKTMGELNRFRTDINRILAEKNIDRGLVSLLERRLEAKQEWAEQYKIHLDNFEKLDKTIKEPNEKNKKLVEEKTRFTRSVSALDQKFGNEIFEICKSLTSTYKSNFLWSDLYMYQQLQPDLNTILFNDSNKTGKPAGTAGISKEILVGQWKTETGGLVVGTLYQYDNGKMYYYFAHDSSYGRWELKDNILFQYYDQFYAAGSVYKYNISNTTDTSFTFTLDNPPRTVFNAVRFK